VNTIRDLWKKLAKKKYREEFVAAQVKRGIPFQIRELMKRLGLSQEELAARSGLTQGVVSRAANLNYGNLTLNTIIRIAAGLDVGFVGKFVPFSELGDWFLNLSEHTARVKTFEDEDREMNVENAMNKLLTVNIEEFRKRQTEQGKVFGAAAGASFSSTQADNNSLTGAIPAPGHTGAHGALDQRRRPPQSAQAGYAGAQWIS
jgi:transcriptional regulator with XRE-family HTH domain